MSADTRRLESLMAQAVDISLRHVEGGGLPFVGLLASDDGRPSALGVNLVRETGDVSAHAEIVAMRQILADSGRTSLGGMTLLATGEPCALCYQDAARHGVDSVVFAVDRDDAAEWGFDYRDGYDAMAVDALPIARAAQHLPVARGQEPFVRYLELHPRTP